jgi:C-methyltransferase C-terminal domain/Putative zinc binding domain/Methyltransferase domain
MGVDLPCRGCGAPLRHTFVDLGTTPLANSYLQPADLTRSEDFFPLKAFVCDQCLLVQLPVVQSAAEIFTDYAYFSSYSESWLQHARTYAERTIGELGLDASHLVIELASNDGYLLQFFHRQGIPVLGVEPAANVAEAAQRAGIPTLVAFFGAGAARELVARDQRADLLVANNVLAHVPDLNDFVQGIKIVLGRQGLATLEFPHLLRLVEGNQFDTIYHEHFSYFSLLAVRRVFARHGLAVVDVDELTTHGGSLRLHVRHVEDGTHPASERVARLLAVETAAGMAHLDYYRAFDERVKETKRELLDFLIGVKRKGQSVVGYGAPAKGNTLLNYCGVRTDFLDYTVDRSPHKQGRLLPGTRIPICAPERIRETRPDYVLILPWNLRDEIVEQMAYVREWGGRFVVPVPRVATIA